MPAVTDVVVHGLLSSLLAHADRSAARVDFFSSVLHSLVGTTECDADLVLHEAKHTYRCVLGTGDRAQFRFERQTTADDECCGPEVFRGADAQAKAVSTPRGTWFVEELPEPSEARSIACFPLVAGLERVGVLYLQSSQPGLFTPSTIEIYEKVGEALAVALVFHRAQWATRERVKELTCLYAIAQVAEMQNLGIDQVLQRIAALLPAGWQYPELCVATIRIDGVAYGACPQVPPVAAQTAPIVLGGETRGVVEIGYQAYRPELDEGPFLVEERKLIDEVARQIGLIVKRRQTDEEKGRLQGQLLHADRLATIGQLAAGVAHELNEPLGAVLGFAQLAKKSPRLPRQAGQDLDRIIRAALHAREVVKKLMVFGRQSPPQKALVNLNHIVEEGLELVRPRCDSDGVRMEYQLAPGLPLITADPNQIHQVLVNLVVNSIQAMPNGGTILIATRANGNGVCLAVEDSGIGMDDEVLKRIFLPFYTTKGVGQGTGLGLCVVHGIVTSHGGTIEVDSKPGRGTRFEVRLPATAPTQ